MYFTFQDSDLEWFAHASGDRNPLHMNADYAGHTAFGQRVVFGVMGALAVLSATARKPEKKVATISLEFRHPMYLGRKYQFVERASDQQRQVYELCDAETTVLRVLLSFETSAKEIVDEETLRNLPSWSKRESAAIRETHDLSTSTALRGVYQCEAGDPSAPKWFETVVSRFGTGLVDTLMASSYLVGMECPGEKALFSKLNLNLHEGRKTPGQQLGFNLQPESFNRAFNLLQMTFSSSHSSGLQANGQLEAFVREPLPLPDQAEILAGFSAIKTGLRGKSAVVTGGSRGLGAALTLGLASLGCCVYNVFRSSRAQAETVAETGADFPGRIELVQGDIGDAEFCESLAARIQAAHGSLDLLICNAATTPAAMQGEQQLQEGQDYQQANTAITTTPLQKLLPVLSKKTGVVVAVSSVFVEQRPAAFAHYVAVKDKVEAELQNYAQEYPELAFLLPRAPRMRTEMTNTPQAMLDAIPPVSVAAAIVNAVVATPEAGRATVIPADDLVLPDRAAAERSNDELVPGVMISAGFTADPIAESLRFWSKTLDLPMTLSHLDYNQSFRQLLDPSSELAGNPGGINVLLVRVVDWLREWDNSSAEGEQDFLKGIAREYGDALVQFAKRSRSPVLVLLCPSADARLAGIVADIESKLLELNDGASGLCVLKAADYHAMYAVGDFLDPVRDELGHIPYSAEYFHFLGTLITRFYHAIVSKPYKVIACDCDNTLWQGVCGEEGALGVRVEPSQARLQRFLQTKIEQGMLLCLCSKNHPEDVYAVLEQNPGCLLTRQDCTAAAISWGAKSEGLQTLAQQLNLGLDSFIFIDDNPLECAEVRARCPEVLTLEWPADATSAEILLDHTWAFDRFLVTDEDSQRTAMYRAEQERGAVQAQTRDYSEFLRSLQLQIDFRPPTDAEMARVSQLSYRTNQFNFSAKRRSVSELGELLASENNGCRIVRCRDRFGDYGLVGVLIFSSDSSQWTIDSFLLSCRVLGRGVEHHMLKKAAELARQAGFTEIAIDLQPTEKNEPARRFLADIVGQPVTAEQPATSLKVSAETLTALTFEPDREANAETKTGTKPSPKSGRSTQRDITPLTHALSSLKDLAAAIEAESEGSVGKQPDSEPSDTQTRVREIFSTVLNTQPHQLSGADELDHYVEDSFTVVELTVALKREFPSIPTTFLYEHRTIDDIVAALSASTKVAIAEEDHASGDKRQPPRSPSDDDEAIAIVGMSCRLPDADSVDAFWKLLREGRSAFTAAPEDRWKAGELEHAGEIRAGFIDDMDRFDAALFGISPREALYMDPQQRLFLECAWALLEDACYTRERLARDTGVFVGLISNDYGIHTSDPAAAGEVPYRWTDYYQVANRVSYCFDLHGPSISLDTACSSSGTAIHLACESLRHGECSTAIAGGVNLFLHPSRFVQYRQMGIISDSGVCRPFGADADGTLYGEGAACLLLKPLSAAERDGDRIHGVIRGSAMNSGGRTNGFTVPNPMAQADLVEKALNRARLKANGIGYVEAHGTGTALGDPIEVRGLAEAFSRCSSDEVDSRHPCALGSVKGNIGHLESAAAVTGVIKVLLQMREGALAPSLNAEPSNPMIDFEDTPFSPQTALSDWPRPSADTPRRAGVSSFGAGGANAHLILEEYCNAEEHTAASSPGNYSMVLPVSANNSDALCRQVERLCDLLQTHPEISLQRVAYTLQVGREPLGERVAFIAGSVEETLRLMRCYLQEPTDNNAVFRGRTDSRFANVFNAVDASQLSAESNSALPLRKLALLWANGATIDWQSLYGNDKPRPIALPSYPFGGQHYYLPGELPEHANTALPATENPLIGDRFASPFIEATLYHARYSLNALPYLAGHRIHEQIIVPGSLYIALAATLMVEESVSYPLGFANVTFLKAITLPEHGEIDIQTAWRQQDGSLDIMASENGDEWQSHCTLEVASPPAPSSTQTPSLESLRARCTEFLEPASFYALGDALGFHWRAGFQAVQALYRAPGEALAEVNLDPQLVDKRHACAIHPAFLDACFQPFVAALGERHTAAGQPFLPLGVESVTLYQPVPERVWSYARISEAEQDRSVTFDILLFSTDGVLCAEFRRMTALRASSSDLSETNGLPPQSLYRMAWEPVSAPKSTPVEQTWALISLASQPSPIAEQLRNLGLSVNQLSADALDAEYLRDVSQVVLDVPMLSNENEVIAQFDVVWRTLQRCVQTLLDNSVHAARLWLVTRATQSVEESDESAVALLNGALWGIGRSLAWEHPELWGGLLDVGADPAAHDPRVLYSLLNGDSGEDQLVIRNKDQVFACRIRPHSIASESRECPLTVTQDATYLITGGLGSLGRAECDWLLARGAREIVLVGRRAPDSDARRWMENRQQSGVNLRYRQVDLGEQQQVQSLIAELRSQGPALRGVIHCAGCLDDALFMHLGAEQKQRVMRSKALAAWYLHQALADHALDFFVMTSTASTLLGSAGQTNYVFANSFLEALTRYRRRRGLPALAVAWGPWEGSHMLASAAESQQRSWTGTDYGALPLARAGAIFDLAQRQHISELAVLPYHWQSLLRDLGSSRLPSPLKSFEQYIDAQKSNFSTSAAKDSAPAPVESKQAVADAIVEIINQLLGYGGQDAFDRGARFHDIGLDSLTAVRLRNQLNQQFALKLPATVVFDHPNVAALSTEIWSQLSVQSDNNAEDGLKPESPPMQKALTQLSEEEANDELERELREVSNYYD